MDAYIQLVERIARYSGLAKEDIERKVEAKRAKLSGLVSKEGAAQIVAAELGVNFEKEKLKLSELMQGMKKANTVAKVVEISPVRSYQKQDREGKVCNLILADDSARVKTVLWDTNHISLIEQGKLKVGDVVEVSNGNMRNGELHLSSFSDIKISKETLNEVAANSVVVTSSLKDAKLGQPAKIRAYVVQVFEPRYFEVCPECGKKVLENECKVHGSVTPKQRALLNLVLDDGTETIRSTLFGDSIYMLGLNEEEVFKVEKFLEKKSSILGEEKIFSGNIKANQLYNTHEFTIEKVENIDVDSLLKELEAKA